MSENAKPTPRAEVVALIAENKHKLVGDALLDFWRRHVEDLIAGGVDEKEAIESMVAVATIAHMGAFGATTTARALGMQADLQEAWAAGGQEFPLPDPFKH